MKVSEAIEILNKMRPDDDLVVKNGQRGIGPIGTTKVTRLVSGFDWDHGKVFVDTEDSLRLETEIDRIASSLLYKLLDNEAVIRIMNRNGDKIDQRQRTRQIKETCEKAMEEVYELRE